jgi:pimeloyl-ACP methyl ester carboxylesterase
MREMSEFADRFWRSHDGLRLFARDYAGGSGQARLPVVCIHGLTRNGRDFEAVAPQLALGGRRILVPDIRGRGRSEADPNPQNYNPGVYALDVAGLLDASGIARALFIGTSMGGLITMALAAMRPALVAGAALNDVGPELAPAGLARIASYAGRPATVRNWDDAANYARDVNEAAFPGRDRGYWEAVARRLFREGADGQPVLDYDPHIADGLKIDPAAAPRPDPWPLFLGLAHGRPTLLIRGGLSDLIDPSIATLMRAAAPDMAYAEVPGVGHAPALDEPEAKAALDAFLDSAP